jgi:hypothetical protein
MTKYIEEPAQTFCYCGEPLQIYNVPYGYTALPIKWVKDGCSKCKKKLTEQPKKQYIKV